MCGQRGPGGRGLVAATQRAHQVHVQLVGAGVQLGLGAALGHDLGFGDQDLHEVAQPRAVALLGQLIGLLGGGRLRSNLAARNAEFDVAVEIYNAAVVDALRDVTAQLTSLRWLGERVREQDQALAAAEQAYELSEQRYRAGLGNFVQVLIAETQVVAQRRAQAELDARAYELDVNLVRALGGGYQAAAAH